MREAGIVAVSDDGMPMADGALMRRALEYSSMFDLPVIVARGGSRPGRRRRDERGADLVPPRAARACRPPPRRRWWPATRAARAHRRTPARRPRQHGGHACAWCARPRSAGLSVTAEVTPHHFTLTDEAVGELRHQRQDEAAAAHGRRTSRRSIDGLRDGVIDVIASDHAPHHRDEKDVEFDCAAYGIVGLETLLPLCAASGARARRAAGNDRTRADGQPGTHARYCRRASLAAGSAGRRHGDRSRAGVDACERGALHSKSKNTPFDGWTMKGAARTTDRRWPDRMAGRARRWPRKEVRNDESTPGAGRRHRFRGRRFRRPMARRSARSSSTPR